MKAGYLVSYSVHREYMDIIDVRIERVGDMAFCEQLISTRIQVHLGVSAPVSAWCCHRV